MQQWIDLAEIWTTIHFLHAHRASIAFTRFPPSAEPSSSRLDEAAIGTTTTVALLQNVSCNSAIQISAQLTRASGLLSKISSIFLIVTLSSAIFLYISRPLRFSRICSGLVAPS